MPEIMTTGVTGLLAFQRALATTGHNIANANTEGYSRQRTDLVSRAPQALAPGFIGRGTQVAGVRRMQDEFANLQLREATSESSRIGRYSELTSRIDNILGDTESGLPAALQGFFDASQEVADDPTSTVARGMLLGQANSLVQRFHTLGQRLEGVAEEVDGRIRSAVTDINALAKNVAELNEKIAVSAAASDAEAPNDLLDQRDQLVNRIAELVSVTVLEQDNGALNVFAGNGQAIVLGSHANALTVTPDASDPLRSRIGYDGINGPVIVDDQLNGGSLGGALDFRRETLDGARNQLGRVAMVLSDTVNAQHRQGLDLDGEFGLDLFTTPVPAVLDDANNTGAGSVSATVNDSSALSSSDYRLTYDGAAYTLTRLSDNQSQSGPGPFSMDGIEVTPSGAAAAGDSYLIRPTYQGARDIDVAISDSRKLAAAAPLRSEALTANVGSAAVTQAAVVDVADADLLDTAEIRFNAPPTSFDVVNVDDGVTVASGVAYTSGSAIGYNGWQAEISGTPAAGDVFRIERNAGGVSDNRNALLLSELQSQALVGGTASYHEAHGALVGEVGAAARQAQINDEAQTQVLEYARSARDSVSGVNLDEEAVNLTRYQQAYQASAQVIATADALFQTILGVVSR